MKQIKYTLLLKDLRKELGLTQQQVAQRLNTSQQNYQRYEAGLIEPDITTLILLSIIFDVSINDLIKYEKIGFDE